MHGTFTNRKEAGQLLSGLLASRGYARPIVLALSSGGVPVGYEIARALGAPLGLLLATSEEASARRWSPELARRALDLALGPSGSRVTGIERDAGVAPECDSSCLRGKEGPPLDVVGRTMILVEDWIASVGPVAAVLSGLRRRRPRRVVLSTPVSSLDVHAELERELDEVICLCRPARGAAPTDCYACLEPVTDASVIALLERAALPDRGA